MRHTVNALRLIIIILWIAVLLLPVSVALSMWKIFETRNNVCLGEPSFFISNGNLSFSVPLYMNNTGFYDISELGINIQLCDGSKKILKFSTKPLSIAAGRTVKSNLSASVSLTEVFSRDRELLTNSKDLNVSIALRFQAASILAFNVARNFTYKWGPPFSNLTINYMGKNITHISFSVGFHNNASFPLSGSLHVKLYNLQNVSIGSAVQALDVESNGFYQKLIEIRVSEAVEEGIIRLYFADVLISEERWGSL